MKILLKVSIVFIALSFFYFFKTVNKSSQNFLSLSEAEKIEKNIYNDFKKEIIVTRSDEMEDQVIKLKDKKIKFDIKHFGEQGEDGGVCLFHFMEEEVPQKVRTIGYGIGIKHYMN